MRSFCLIRVTLRILLSGVAWSILEISAAEDLTRNPNLGTQIKTHDANELIAADVNEHSAAASDVGEHSAGRSDGPKNDESLAEESRLVQRTRMSPTIVDSPSEGYDTSIILNKVRETYLQPQHENPLLQPSSAGISVDSQHKLEAFIEIFEKTLSELDELKNRPTIAFPSTSSNDQHERDSLATLPHAVHLSEQAKALRSLENLFTQVMGKEAKGKGILEQPGGRSENHPEGLKGSPQGALQDATDPVLEILNSFVKDVENNQLMTQSDLEVFVNGRNKQNLIASHLLQTLNSIKSAGALAYKTSYLSFDLRLTFLKNGFGQKIPSITKFLDEESWKKIEFEFLEKAVELLAQKTSDENKDFLPILSHTMSFIKFIAFSSALSPSDKSFMEGDLKTLLRAMYAALIESKAEWPILRNPMHMIDIKLFHNILRFLGRYHVFTDPTSLVNDVFPEAGVFEAAIALASSAVLLNHRIYSSRGIQAYGCVTDLENPLEMFMFIQDKAKLLDYIDETPDKMVGVEFLPESLRSDQNVIHALQLFAFANLAFMHQREVYHHLTHSSGLSQLFFESWPVLCSAWLPDIVQAFLVARR